MGSLIASVKAGVWIIPSVLELINLGTESVPHAFVSMKVYWDQLHPNYNWFFHANDALEVAYSLPLQLFIFL